MHSAALVLGLLALFFANAATSECFPTLGEGDRICHPIHKTEMASPSHSNTWPRPPLLTPAQIACQGGKMVFFRDCKPGRCTFDKDPKAPYCTSSADDFDGHVAEEVLDALQGAKAGVSREAGRPRRVLPHKDDQARHRPYQKIAGKVPERSPGYCGFPKEVGDKCPTIIKEGDMLCDKACKNMLICHNGTMELKQACGLHRDCHSNSSAHLGQGLYCRNKTDPRPPPVELFERPVVLNPACEEAWELAENAYDDYQKAIAAWCLSRRFADQRAAWVAYSKGQETSGQVRDVCSLDDGRELPFDPDDSLEDFYEDMQSCPSPEVSTPEDSRSDASKNRMYKAQTCSPVQHTPSEPCAQNLEAQTYCDMSCKKILICHDKIWQVNNECGGACAFVPESNAAFCV